MGKVIVVFGAAECRITDFSKRDELIWGIMSHRIHVCCMIYLPIFTYIWLMFMVNVGKYTIHGWYGYFMFESLIFVRNPILVD